MICNPYMSTKFQKRICNKNLAESKQKKVLTVILNTLETEMH